MLRLELAAAASDGAIRSYEQIAAEILAEAARGVMSDGRRFGGLPKPYSPPEVPDGKDKAKDCEVERLIP